MHVTPPLLRSLLYCPPLVLLVVDTTATPTDRLEVAKVCGRLPLKDGANAVCLHVACRSMMMAKLMLLLMLALELLKMSKITPAK